MNTFERDLDEAAERARRFFADARAADRRPGALASAALSLSETLVSLAFRSERSQEADAPETPAQPRLALFAPQTSDEEPTILRLDAFRPTPRVAAAPQPEPKRAPTLKIFAADAEPSRRAAAPQPEPKRAPTLKIFAADAEPSRRAFPRLFVPADERPRLRVVAAD